jgi:hypothetical protein
METKDGYRTTIEAGRTALTRACEVLWASMHNLWQQIRTQFRS